MSELNTLLSDDQIERFIADGFLIVQSDVDKALHARVERVCARLMQRNLGMAITYCRGFPNCMRSYNVQWFAEP